jgi:hypothetical protein
VKLPAACETSQASDDASEVAEAVAQLLHSHEGVPDEAVRDLRRLVSHDLARRNTARLRLGHLRLLIEIVAQLEDDDPWVSQVEYTRERTRRAARGELHPDESTLRSAYGRWVSAVRAASRFVQRGGEGRVPANYRHCQPCRKPYTLEGIIDALLRCYSDLGDWPTEWEYHEWAAIKRHLCADDPRLPGAKQIRKCFDDFSEARSAAKAGLAANSDNNGPATGGADA